MTSNFERLASQSVLFTNAHCIALSCGPVRAAIISGIPQWKSGLYHNMQPIRDIMPDVTLMPRHFANNGYHAAGAGKILHYIIDPPSWADYFPEREKDNPLPFTRYPEKRPVNLPRGGPWQYVETDWTPLDASDEEFGGDYSVTEWVSRQLASIHFADTMLGRVLDALEKSPRRDNTIVVLWSDHGWHLGEKEHWQKYTGWRACSRAPYMIHVPKGTPGLPGGTTAGVCGKPVSTFDTFRTLVSLTGIRERENLYGHDLTPLLENPNADWPHHAITQLGKPRESSSPMTACPP